MTTIRSQRTNTRNLLHPSLAERANVVLGCSGSDDHGTVKAFASMPLQMLCNQTSPALRYTLWRLKLVKPRITISSVFEWLLHTPFDGSHPSKCNHRMMIIIKKKLFSGDYTIRLQSPADPSMEIRFPIIICHSCYFWSATFAIYTLSCHCEIHDSSGQLSI